MEATAVQSKQDIWDMARSEREALLTDLERLTPAQWETQSLCSEWTVRDVVAHIAVTPEVTMRTGLPALMASGFDLNRANVRMARKKARLSPAELLAELRRMSASTGTPPGARPVNVLADTVVHSQDIRRPLGIQRTFPEGTLRVVADLLATDNFNVKSKRRVSGLRLEASDLEWSSGEGALVRGALESLIMAMAGRSSALVELEGDGVAILRDRC